MTNPDGSLSRQKVKVITQQLALLHESGHELILVSSGAVAAGFGALGFKTAEQGGEQTSSLRQLVKGLLMEEYIVNLSYATLFPQILLTQDDFADQRRYKNAHQAISFAQSLGHSDYQ